MELKYRVIQHDFPFEPPIWIAQYKILWMWFNIGITQRGYFFKQTQTQCESPTEAAKRIGLHKRNMKRSSWWWDKTQTIIIKEHR